MAVRHDKPLLPYLFLPETCCRSGTRDHDLVTERNPGTACRDARWVSGVVAGRGLVECLIDHGDRCGTAEKSDVQDLFC
jgi:hypothetical protein